jgi:hypothetical protein
MPMLESCQHRAMTCGRHACMPIRRLMLLALQSAEGSVPSDVLAGFKRAESASTNCIITFNAIECRTHVKPSLPLRGTCWLPRHCRCPIMVSAHLLMRLFAPLHGSGLRLCDLFLLWVFCVQRCSRTQSGRNLLGSQPSPRPKAGRVEGRRMRRPRVTLLQNPARCSPAQPRNLKTPK